MSVRLSLPQRIPFAIGAEDVTAGPPAADRLQWDGATQEQLEFMRRVYRKHIERSARRRRFVPTVPRSAREVVENGQYLRTPAAHNCRAMLATARAVLAQEQAEGKEAALKVKEFGARSGYRSVDTQLSGWQAAFRTKYYPNTQQTREGLPGGAHGDAAVDFMATYVGGRIAAPGYSLHNSGLAMDFFSREGGRNLGPDSGAMSVRAWKESWLFSWLSQRAHEFRFFQNPAIVEPWHWEYRAPSTAEATVNAGRLAIRQAPPLSSHQGTPPELILRWNAMASVPDKVDVVLHLHGFSKHGHAMLLDSHKEPFSGLDFEDPDKPGTGGGRTRPTLGILPRGSHIAGTAYEFPALANQAGFDALIDYALAQLAGAIGASAVGRDRLILTTHSGGGKALMALLAFANPDEVHVFDALYWSAAPLIQWAQRRIAQDAAAAAPATGAGAVRISFLEPPPGKTWTKPQSLAVHRALKQALKRAGAAGAQLAPRYRVERTAVDHPNVAREYGWRLLADAGATLPRATPP